MKKYISLSALCIVSLHAQQQPRAKISPPILEFASKPTRTPKPPWSPRLAQDRVWRYIEEQSVAKITERMPKVPDKDMANTRGHTLLHAAVGTKNVDVVKAVLDGGVGVDVRDFNGQTALHWAAYEGSVPIVEFLISRGAKKSAVDNDGNRPSDLATQSYGHARDKIKIKTLLTTGSQITTETESE